MNLLDEDHRAKLAAVVVLIILILGFIFIYSQSEEDIVVDRQTQCPIDDQYIRDYALVLLDGTDDIVGEYAQELHKEVKAIARKLPQYGKLSMHDVATGKKRFFMMCAPKSPDTYNALTENLDKLESVYEKEYLNKVEQAVQAFLDDRNRDQSISPLLETIANVTALSDFLQTENREFYMFSDMLQNYNGYSHYRGLSPEELIGYEDKIYTNILNRS